MLFGLSTALTPPQTLLADGGAAPVIPPQPQPEPEPEPEPAPEPQPEPEPTLAPVLAALGARNGFAIDFRAGQMLINDAATPANAFLGDPAQRLTIWGADAYEVDPVRGLRIDAARDFSAALATSLFPYNASACTVYIKYRLNNVTTTTQRYLFMIDNDGTDRLAAYSAGGADFPLRHR